MSWKNNFSKKQPTTRDVGLIGVSATPHLLMALELAGTNNLKGANIDTIGLDPSKYPNLKEFYLAMKETETPERKISLWIGRGKMFMFLELLDKTIGKFVTNHAVELCDVTSMKPAKKVLN
jgi:hypothetical protein